MASRGTSVYRIRHPNCSREVIEAVVHALDGPRPMRNFKPSERTPNSVDHFWQTHQAGYEARGRPSKDRVARVQRHNAAHPALKDELDRRLSIAKINAVKNANMHKNHASVTCLKRKRISHRLKESTVNRRSQSAVRTRPMKSKYRERQNDYRCRRAKNRLKFRNQYCQVKTPTIDKKIGKDCYELLNQSSSVEKSNQALAPKGIEPQAIKGTELGESSKKQQKIYENTEKISNSSKVGSLVHPATTDPSVTSYNSFFSLDHEPMVSD